MTKKKPHVNFTGDVRSRSDPDYPYVVIIPEHGSLLGEGHVLLEDEIKEVVARYKKFHSLHEGERR